MKFVRKIRELRLGHDGNLEKLAVPLWPDAGKALGLSRNHTYEAARAGEIPTVKFGRYHPGAAERPPQDAGGRRKEVTAPSMAGSGTGRDETA